MSKSLLYRFFGIGEIPENYRSALAGEGVVLADEGVGGSVTYRNFRSPQRYANWKKQWHVASIALTKKRLAAFRFSTPVIDVALADGRFRKLEFSLEHESALLVRFDASLFHADWSGAIEYRFKTPQARDFLNELRKDVD